MNPKLQNIFSIISFALAALAAIVPGTAGAVAIEQALQRILMSALAAYQAESGQPFDITKIPLQTKVD